MRPGKLKASRGDILGVPGAHELDEIVRGVQGEHERQELAGARDPVERARPQLALDGGEARGVGLALVDTAVVALAR